MAYGDNVLNASHKWAFNNTLNDDIGSLTLTNVGGSFVATPITRDSTHSYQTNGRDDRAETAGGATTNATAMTEYAVGGWFMASQIQGPPCMIFKQGGTTHGYAIFLWAGNNVMFQNLIDTGTTAQIQIFSDFALEDNRAYHLLFKFSGNGIDNEFSAYIDGVKQLLADPSDRQPDSANVPIHTGSLAWGEPGDTGLDVTVGTEAVLIKAPVNGFYSQWWSWNGNDAALTDSNIRDDIFAPGAIPDVTITSDTEANMQIQLDALASTVRPNEPLCILVEQVTGDGDLTLTADNITFDEKASIHVRYEGNGKLTWINNNGSNASLGSSTNQSIDFVESIPLTVTALDATTLAPIENARIYITQDSNSDIIFNDLTNASGQVTTNYSYIQDEAISGVARKSTSSPYYSQAQIAATITQNGLNYTALMILDE